MEPALLLAKGGLVWPPDFLKRMNSTTFSKQHNWIDQTGIWLSFICIIHCIVTPFLILLLPALTFLSDGSGIHGVLAIVLSLVSALAFVPGYFRHRDKLVILRASVGLSLIVTMAFQTGLSERLEFFGTVVGSVLLIRTHIRNRALANCCSGGR